MWFWLSEDLLNKVNGKPFAHRMHLNKETDRLEHTSGIILFYILK